ncbi:phosphate transporter [Gonapodya sp. JEL0774]|nr:phosphate transporter [Gonapodya sp. JEL0774]
MNRAIAIPILNVLTVVFGYLCLFIVWAIGGLFIMLYLMFRRLWLIFTEGTRLFDLSGETIVVTGGSSGIGLALVTFLSARYPNCTLCVLDVQPLKLDSSPHPNIRYYKCDISNCDEVSQVAKKLLEEAGPPAVLVNNAGIVQSGRTWELDPSKVQKVFAVNVLAHFWTIRAFLPAMLKRNKGHIVTVASALGTTGVAGLADYCASKSAAIGLTESIRQDLRGTNIFTHLVAPGLVTTDMFAAVHPMTIPFLTPPVSPDDVVQSLVASIERNEHSEIKVPFYTHFAFLFRILPPRLADMFSWVHVRAILVAGTGFLTDSYDNFIIGLIVPCIAYVYYPGSKGALSSVEDGFIKAASSYGNLCGQFFFGILGDVFGRKKMYGIELIILIIGALGCALTAAPVRSTLSFTAILGFWRFVLGVGVGGDYPVSAVITSEFASVRRRGQMIAIVFAMQGLGILMGAIVAVATLAAYKPLIFRDEANPDYLQLDQVWRVFAGWGIIPAMAAVYFRLTIPETPRFTVAIDGDVEKAAADSAKFLAGTNEIPVAGATIAVNKQKAQESAKKGYIQNFKEYFGVWKNARVLLGTSLTWFFLDIGYYGTNLNTSVILSAIGYADKTNPYTDLWTRAVGNCIIALAGNVPGYWFTVALVEVVGRKPIQYMGFFMLTLIFALIAGLYPTLKEHSAAFVFLYALAQFFFNFGPNSTTFIIPAECFPTRVRSSGHGISAASGKAGAILAAQAFSLIANIGGTNNNVQATMALFAACCAAGFVFTAWVPETKGKSLEALGGEDELFALDDVEEEKKDLQYTISEREEPSCVAIHDGVVPGGKGIAQRSPEWYAVRKTLITASEAGVLLRKTPATVESYCHSFNIPISKVADNKPVSSFKSRKGLFEEKLGLRPSSTGSRLTEWGTRYEPMAVRFYERLKGVQVEERGLMRHPELDWVAASPDGYVPAHPSRQDSSRLLPERLIEVKCPFQRRLDSSVVPLQYWIQMQIQMEVCGVDLCDFFEVRIREYWSEGDFLADFVSPNWHRGAYLMVNDSKRKAWEKATLAEQSIGEELVLDFDSSTTLDQASDSNAQVHAVMNADGSVVDYSIPSETRENDLGGTFRERGQPQFAPTILLPPKDIIRPQDFSLWVHTLLKQQYPPSDVPELSIEQPTKGKESQLGDARGFQTYASFYRPKFYHVEAFDIKTVTRDRVWFRGVRSLLEANAEELRTRLKDLEEGSEGPPLDDDSEDGLVVVLSGKSDSESDGPPNGQGDHPSVVGVSASVRRSTIKEMKPGIKHTKSSERRDTAESQDEPSGTTSVNAPGNSGGDAVIVENVRPSVLVAAKMVEGDALVEVQPQRDDNVPLSDLVKTKAKRSKRPAKRKPEGGTEEPDTHTQRKSERSTKGSNLEQFSRDVEDGQESNAEPKLTAKRVVGKGKRSKHAGDDLIVEPVDANAVLRTPEDRNAEEVYSGEQPSRKSRISRVTKDAVQSKQERRYDALKVRAGETILLSIKTQEIADSSSSQRKEGNKNIDGVVAVDGIHRSSRRKRTNNELKQSLSAFAHQYPEDLMENEQEQAVNKALKFLHGKSVR